MAKRRKVAIQERDEVREARKECDRRNGTMNQKILRKSVLVVTIETWEPVFDGDVKAARARAARTHQFYEDYIRKLAPITASALEISEPFAAVRK